MANIAFTMWQNDLVALGVWVKYYSQQFDRLLILCFNTKPEYFTELDKLKEEFNLQYEVAPDGVADPRVSSLFLRDKQVALLREYEWVLFANVDEILVPAKKFGTLKNLILESTKDKTMLICEAFDVIQVEGEDPINYTKPYLRQRKYWIKNHNYNKILLARIPLIWNEGLHQIDGMTNEESRGFKDTGLYLLHLKHADMEREGDFGPKLSSLDPNITRHWLDKKEEIPAYIRRAF